jgi:tRNA A-37 threonylcarbamoyl transferase component Bud32
MPFNVGENIGPYRIIEQLGQGGMATVYKAYHAALDRYVALKVLHPAFHEDQTFTARFQREARVVAKLEHPNIVPVYDYSEHEMRPYLVMKYIEGDTLKARLNQGPLSSEEIEQVVNSVGSALSYAHKQGILHRDIKPSNVLIATDGVMYLADFGLARIAQAGESTLSSDSIMGTPQYISPEQAMGKKDLNEGTDLYSFGVMLYEMVVGQVPFSADTPFSIIHDHIYTPLPLPMDINPEVPEPVQRVLLKALAKDRKDRYESVSEMVRAFRDAWTEAGVPMQGTSITMRPASLKQAAETGSKPRQEPIGGATVASRGPAAKKRSPWTWVAVGVVACLCLSVAAVALRNRGLPANDGPTKVPTIPAIVTDTAGPNTPPTLQGASPEVTAALELVLKEPGSPTAHLQLSLALWDNEQFRPAIEELAQAANLAGPTNRDFFLKAAEEFKAREAWVPASGMYLRMIATYGGGEIPEDVETNFHEAVYKAAEQKDMPLFVFFERVDAVDLSMGYVVRGRYALFNGSMQDAKAQLSNAQNVRSDMYEVFLLEAEINFKDGQISKARSILTSLASDLGAPQWVRTLANDYLKNMP